MQESRVILALSEQSTALRASTVLPAALELRWAGPCAGTWGLELDLPLSLWPHVARSFGQLLSTERGRRH